MWMRDCQLSYKETASWAAIRVFGHTPTRHRHQFLTACIYPFCLQKAMVLLICARHAGTNMVETPRWRVGVVKMATAGRRGT
jgi:hypothetical protein